MWNLREPYSRAIFSKRTIYGTSRWTSIGNARVKGKAKWKRCLLNSNRCATQQSRTRSCSRWIWQAITFLAKLRWPLQALYWKGWIPHRLCNRSTKQCKQAKFSQAAYLASTRYHSCLSLWRTGTVEAVWLREPTLFNNKSKISKKFAKNEWFIRT